MDFSSMNGYDFERYITSLLNRLGFTAQQTSLSGDGGIDIYAYNNKPFLKGYYLFQCKNWTNPVGQPEVRDLYGVVMSKRANKGILITTSSFTDKAIEFANGLNIELIDGKSLYEIAASVNPESTSSETKSSHFYDDTSFDYERYQYLRNRIKSKRDYNAYEEYLAFLLSYVDPNQYFMLEKGLAEEIISICNDIIPKFCRKGKSSFAKRNSHVFIQAYIYFLVGNIAASIECMNELDLFSFNLRTEVYVPCQTRLVDQYNYELERLPNWTLIEDNGILGKVYFTDECNRFQPMVTNLLILLNQINEKDDLTAFERFLSSGLTRIPFSSQNIYETSKVLRYLADYSMEVIYQINCRAEELYNKSVSQENSQISLIESENRSVNSDANNTIRETSHCNKSDSFDLQDLRRRAIEKLKAKGSTNKYIQVQDKYIQANIQAVKEHDKLEKQRIERERQLSNIKDRILQENIRGYKWYPYVFSLTKGEEYSIERTCCDHKSIDVQESLTSRWNDLNIIKEEINKIVRMLGFLNNIAT